MKKKVHPKYYPNAKVTCSCGNTFTTGSTLPEIKVEICAACHPFFTGEQKFVDTLGRVERFQQKLQQAQQYQKKKKDKKKKGKTSQPERPRTLKEMLKQAR